MTRLWRGRIATSLLFLLFGTALGAWTARIPAVKSRLGLSDGRLSIALLAFAAGCIVGMAVLGRLTDRFGARALSCLRSGLLCGRCLPRLYGRHQRISSGIHGFPGTP